MKDFICSECGEVHKEWPALAFSSPSYYAWLTKEEQQNLGKLGSDFCEIHHPDQIDRFIRVVLDQKVVDNCDTLSYGLWVSLSAQSYEDYSTNFDNSNHEASYFGWLSNKIWAYDDTLSIPMTITTQQDKRPYAVPHQDFDHPFVRDFYQGISKIEAQRRVDELLNHINSSK